MRRSKQKQEEIALFTEALQLTIEGMKALGISRSDCDLNAQELYDYVISAESLIKKWLDGNLGSINLGDGIIVRFMAYESLKRKGLWKYKISVGNGELVEWLKKEKSQRGLKVKFVR